MKKNFLNKKEKSGHVSEKINKYYHIDSKEDHSRKEAIEKFGGYLTDKVKVSGKGLSFKQILRIAEKNYLKEYGHKYGKNSS